MGRMKDNKKKIPIKRHQSLIMLPMVRTVVKLSSKFH